MGLGQRKRRTLRRLAVGATVHGMIHRPTGKEWVGADDAVHKIVTALVFTEVGKTVFSRQSIRFGRINVGFRNEPGCRPPFPGYAFRAKVGEPLNGGRGPFWVTPSKIFTLTDIEIGQPIPEHFFQQGCPRRTDEPVLNLALALAGRLSRPFAPLQESEIQSHWLRQGFWYEDGQPRGVYTRPTKTSMFMLSDSGFKFRYLAPDDMHAVARATCETVRDFGDGWLKVESDLEEHCMTLWAHAQLYRLLTMGCEPPPHRRQEAIQLAKDLRARYASEAAPVRPFAPPSKPSNPLQTYYLQFYRQRLGRIRAVHPEA